MLSLFKKTIYDIDPPAFGLDISDLSLKILELEKSRGYLGLSGFTSKVIPEGIITSGEIIDPKRAVLVIKEALSGLARHKLKSKYTICSLPEEKAFTRVIQLPKMKKDEVREAVKWEAENNIPLPLEEVYLDFQVVPPIFDHLDHFDVLIIAVPRKVVDSYVEILKEAGILPKVLEVESTAIIRSVVKGGFSSSPLLVIDLGAVRTSFIIFSGYTIRFTSSIEISGRGLTDALVREFNISHSEAEKLKKEAGLDRKKEKGKVFETLIPILADLTEQIKDYLAFYESHALHEHSKPGEKPGVISKIILCGGGAGLKGLDSHLSLALKMPVEKANPWINILPSPLREVPELPYERSLAYTTALGLALRGIQQY